MEWMTGLRRPSISCRGRWVLLLYCVLIIVHRAHIFTEIIVSASWTIHSKWQRLCTVKPLLTELALTRLPSTLNIAFCPKSTYSYINITFIIKILSKLYPHYHGNHLWTIFPLSWESPLNYIPLFLKIPSKLYPLYLGNPL